MLKNFFPLFMLLMLLVGCEKPVSDDEQPGAEANLIVEVYQMRLTPFPVFTRTVAENACTRLNYAVYNTSGARVKQLNQTSAEADFGKASFQLEEGTYQLVVVAHSSNGNPTMTDPTKVQFTNAQGFSDTFLYTQQITVGEAPQTLSVITNRIVALCRVALTGSYPEGVTKLQFQYKGGSGAFNANTGLGCVNSTQKMEFDVTSGQKQFDLYTFLHSKEGTIHLTVSALDASGVEILQREFDVPMQQNYITWLSGDLFNGSKVPGTSVGIDINTEWDGELHLTF